MAQTLKQWTMKPALWLALAGALFVASIGLGYHNDQQVAVQAMAMPQGPAPLVAIQDFDAGEHSNLASEVRLIAEVDFGRVVEVTLQGEKGPEQAVLIPLFPVSAAGAAAVNREKTGAPHRPIRRDSAAGRSAVPVGAILSKSSHDVASKLDLDRLVARRIGSGLVGTVVEIAGVARPTLGSRSSVLETLPSRGSGDLVIVEPFVFERNAALPIGDHEELRLTLTRLGTVFLALAAVLAIRPNANSRQKRPARVVTAPVTPQTAAPSASRASIFQPIATQDELYFAEEMEAQIANRRRRESGWTTAFKNRR